MNKHQRHYLDAMGIQVWELRRSISPSDSPSSESREAPETQNKNNEAPETQNNISEIPIDTSTPASYSSDDIPAEYTEWAAMSAGNEMDELPMPEAAVIDNREERVAAMDWEALQNEVAGCTACELHRRRTQAVFGIGNRNTDWMIIGEAPGVDEDRLGEPFVGRSGKLLDQMLMALKLDRTQVFIANIVKCRPPQNRDPQPEEAYSCRPFLERQITLVQPKIILAVGRIAAQNLLQTQIAVSKLRSRVHRFGAAEIPLVVTYHPAYLLRSPREKRKAWDDLQLARSTLLARAQSRL